MKKRDLSKLVIVITIITIVILLYIKYFIVNNYINGFKDIEPKNNKEKVESIDSFKINEESVVYRNKINDFKEKFNENNNEEKTLDDIDYNKNEMINFDVNDINNSANNINNKKQQIQSAPIEKEESIQVFKMDKNELINEVSFKDKITILSIVKNLSSNKYKQLLNNIKRNDELNAAIDIFTILKDNLSKEDYEVLKDIAEPYLNVDIIEKNIK